MTESDSPLLLLSSTGSILWANQDAAVLLGYSDAELTERTIPMTTDPISGITSPAGPIGAGMQMIRLRNAREAKGSARFLTGAGEKIAVNWTLSLLPGSESSSQLLLLLRPAENPRRLDEAAVASLIQVEKVTAALRYTEERFRRLVESTNAIPWETTPSGDRFKYVGPQALTILGYSVESWLEAGFWERATHPEDRVWVRLTRAEALEKQENFECEYRMITAEGKILRIREISTVLHSGDSSSSVGGFLFDVTQRREAEDSLRDTRHLVEQIATASPTISYVYGPRTCEISYVNGRVDDILGFSREGLAEMSPLFVLGLAHPTELDSHYKHFNRIQKSLDDAIVDREFRLRSAMGTWVWVYSRECVFQRDGAGNVTQAVGTLENVTLQRQAMEELEVSEARFRRLAESARVVPFEFDLSLGRFTYMGPQADALLGIASRPWLTRDGWRSMLHPHDLHEGMQFASLPSSDEEVDFQTEFRIHSPDGRLIWLRQIVHRSGNIEHAQQVSGFIFDITASKEIEEAHEQSRTRVRELAAKSHESREQERQSIARELHDELGQGITLLKLDLSLIEGWLHVPTSPGHISESIIKVKDMQGKVDVILQTLRAVLSALRPPLLDELGLTDAIEWHATDFARRATLRCELQLDQIENVPIELSLAIFRIFQEMLTNVAKHARATRLTVELRQSIDALFLLVTDNGKGMDPNAEERGRYGLLGMRERAWAFGGQVWVASTPGKGTTVRAEIPLMTDRSSGTCARLHADHKLDGACDATIRP